MTSSSSAARLRYLNDAAHLLAYSAPSTAAVLQSRYNSILDQHEQLILDSRRKEICSSCGFNMLWIPICLPASTETKEKKTGRSKFDASKAQVEVKKTVLSCCRCHAKTYHEMPPAKRTKGALNENKNAKTAIPDTQPAVEAVDTNKPAGVAPRKRTKARKNQSLQAMFAKSKAEVSAGKSGYGLDLMDLMKGA